MDQLLIINDGSIGNYWNMAIGLPKHLLQLPKKRKNDGKFFPFVRVIGKNKMFFFFFFQIVETRVIFFKKIEYKQTP